MKDKTVKTRLEKLGIVKEWKKNIVNKKKQKTFSVCYTTTTTTSKLGGKAVSLAEKSVHKKRKSQENRRFGLKNLIIFFN